MPTAETTMHPAGAHSGEQSLTREKRLDNPINPFHFSGRGLMSGQPGLFDLDER